MNRLLPLNIKSERDLSDRAYFVARILGILDYDAIVIVTWAKEDESSSFIEMSNGVYLVEIQNNIPDSSIIQHVAHEMTHLRQFLRGDLQHDKAGVKFWKSVPYIESMGDDEFYWLSPWEMEARAMEDYLAHKWENRERELH